MLSFIDISGDPFSVPEKSPWIVAAAVCLKKGCLDEINQTVYRLKRDMLGNERIELKATDLVNPSTLNNPQLCKARYLDRLIIDCVNHPGCNCIAVVFQNSGNNAKSTNDLLPRHYRDLLWRIEATCRESKSQDALVIMDNESRKIDKNLAFSFSNYMYRTASAKVLYSIISIPIFADSEMTTGLQLADIVSGILRQYYKCGLDHIPSCPMESTFHQKLREYAEIINKHSIENVRVGSHKVDGIYLPQNPYNISK